MAARTQIGRVGSHFAVFSLLLVGLIALYFYRILQSASIEQFLGSSVGMALLIPLIAVTFFAMVMSLIALLLYRDRTAQVSVTAIYSISLFLVMYWLLI